MSAYKLGLWGGSGNGVPNDRVVVRVRHGRCEREMFSCGGGDLTKLHDMCDGRQGGVKNLCAVRLVEGGEKGDSCN